MRHQVCNALREIKPYVYLATPYSKYPAGIQMAYVDACRAAAYLVRQGVAVYCPIAHTHPIAIHGNIDPYDHTIWLPCDAPFMEHAGALVVVRMEGWDGSHGIAVEVETFRKQGKPIYHLGWPIPEDES